MANLRKVRVLNNTLVNEASPVEPPLADPKLVEPTRKPWWYLAYTRSIEVLAPPDLPEVFWIDFSMPQADLDDPTLQMKFRVMTSVDAQNWNPFFGADMQFGPNKGKGGGQTTAPFLGVRALQAEGKFVRAEFTTNKPVRLTCFLESNEARGGLKRL